LRAGKPALVDLLLKKGSNKEGRYLKKRSLLHVAVKENHIGLDTIKFLIDSGLDVNARDAEGKTPLMLAIEKGSQKSQAMLRKAGAK
jgi:uncharacterized protein